MDNTSGRVTWECSHDLANYIQNQVRDSKSSLAGLVNSRPESVSVIELGCGQALPACALLQALDGCNYRGSVSICFQDLDAGTLESVTRPYTTGDIQGFSPDFSNRVSSQYLASSWEDMSIPSGSVDVILSSECIYREDLFASHAQAIDSSLSPIGIALVAGKRYYFGCGGGTIAFSDFLATHYPRLNVELVATFENGMSNTREILAISHS